MFNSTEKDLPRWITLPHGVRVFARSFRMVEEAAKSIARESIYLELIASFKSDPAPIDINNVACVYQLMLANSFAVASIIRWEGMENADGGLADVTPDTIHELMMFRSVADTFLRELLPNYFNFAEFVSKIDATVSIPRELTLVKSACAPHIH